MANFKRRRPRMRTFGKGHDKWAVQEMEARGIRYHWMGNWPAWWDVLHHRRPSRRHEAAVAHAVLRGADPDETLWPLSKRPHSYYW